MQANTEYAQKAADLAEKAHEGQTDKAGAPYVHHVERVAKRAMELNLRSATVEVVGWLHDLFEDTEYRGDAVLALGYPQLVVDAVDLLTRREGESYQEMIDRILEAPGTAGDLARSVKQAELRDHLRPEGGDFLSETMLNRYRKALNQLNRKVLHPSEGK